MKNDTNFLNTSPLMVYFNFSNSLDPFMVSTTR